MCLSTFTSLAYRYSSTKRESNTTHDHHDHDAGTLCQQSSFVQLPAFARMCAVYLLGHTIYMVFFFFLLVPLTLLSADRVSFSLFLSLSLRRSPTAAGICSWISLLSRYPSLDLCLSIHLSLLGNTLTFTMNELMNE